MKHSEDCKELQSMIGSDEGYICLEPCNMKAPKEKGTVMLKRTYNQTFDDVTLKFWRVMSEWHPNYGSDLSIEGLKQWGIIQ